MLVVNPIHKKGAYNVDNYRPISIIPKLQNILKLS